MDAVPSNGERTAILRQMARSRAEDTFDARGLSLIVDKVRKTDLVEALEQSDEDVRFDKFIDLPPELRVRIYTMYFLGLPDLPDGPKQPPMCLTSSLVRNESLPLFYSNCIFRVQLVIINDLSLKRNFGQFRAHTPLENLARIKKMQLSFHSRDGWSEWYVDASIERRRMNPDPAVRLIEGQSNSQQDDQMQATLKRIIQSEPEILVEASSQRCQQLSKKSMGISDDFQDRGALVSMLSDVMERYNRHQ